MTNTFSITLWHHPRLTRGRSQQVPKAGGAEPLMLARKGIGGDSHGFGPPLWLKSMEKYLLQINTV
jgi:hypothetical protein